jgi:hypothetical protein
MPNLKKFCPKSREEYAKDITFYEDCRGERKALLQPIKLIDLTIAVSSYYSPSCGLYLISIDQLSPVS